MTLSLLSCYLLKNFPSTAAQISFTFIFRCASIQFLVYALALVRVIIALMISSLCSYEKLQ